MMKTYILIACCFFGLLCYGQDSLHTKPGPHGGTLKAVENYNLELLRSLKIVKVFIYDIEMKAVSNAEASGEILFTYPENLTIINKLKPFSTNALMTEVGNENYASCRVTLTVKGQQLETKFSNQPALARKKNGNKSTKNK